MRDPSELLHRIKMCAFAPPAPSCSLADPVLFSHRLTGVLEVGIFAGMAQAAYFGYPVRWRPDRAPHLSPELTSLDMLSGWNRASSVAGWCVPRSPE